MRLRRVGERYIYNGQYVAHDCVDAAGMFAAYVASAERLDDWYAGGCVGPRPPGRLRRLRPPRLSWWRRALATVPYLLLHDPDGRPRRLRRTQEF